MDRYFNRHKGPILIGIGVILCVLWVPVLYTTGGPGFIATAEAETTNPVEGNPEAIAQGEDLFDEYCSECHGSGSGGRGPNLIDKEWKYGGSDSEVFKSVSDGRPGGMPAMIFDMNEEEIWKVIAFLRSIQEK